MFYFTAGMELQNGQKGEAPFGSIISLVLFCFVNHVFVRWNDIADELFATFIKDFLSSVRLLLDETEFWFEHNGTPALTSKFLCIKTLGFLVN